MSWTPSDEIETYHLHREKLLAAEIALRDQIEQVAALRRQLPLGAPVTTDYVFLEGGEDLYDDSPDSYHETRLSELFSPGKDHLIVIHTMFAASDDEPCVMCNMWADGYNAVAPHVSDKTNLVLVAKADIGKLRQWARGRRWDSIRLLSSHDNTFNRDYRMEEEGGEQNPGVSVFRRVDGTIYHFYSCQAELDGEHNRGIDLYSPVWNLFDLLPDGRGDWMPSYIYSN